MTIKLRHTDNTHSSMVKRCWNKISISQEMLNVPYPLFPIPCSLFPPPPQKNPTFTSQPANPSDLKYVPPVTVVESHRLPESYHQPALKPV